MVTEPFELNGKTVKEAFMKYANSQLVIRFTDGTEFMINSITYEDEITGNDFVVDELEIQKI